MARIVGIKLERETRFTRSVVDPILKQLSSCDAAMVDQQAKERLGPILAEFRKGIAHHRAEGATEERIKQIVSASIRLARQQVDDPQLCAWLCEEFTKAAMPVPIIASHPANRTLH